MFNHFPSRLKAQTVPSFLSTNKVLVYSLSDDCVTSYLLSVFEQLDIKIVIATNLNTNLFIFIIVAFLCFQRFSVCVRAGFLAQKFTRSTNAY